MSFDDPAEATIDMPPSDWAAVCRFEKNDTGRDFVVGDIHGMFDYLRLLLDDVRFNEHEDRLFSVGDLVDRGPQSHEAMDWLAEPWFHACRGNHEQFAIDSEDPEQHDLWVNHNGGGWWLEVDEERQVQFRELFRDLPLALEVETETGVVGIVHADVPPFLSWAQFMELLQTNNRDAVLYAMWSRNRISGACSTMPVGGGVERVYCGHTPTRQIVQIDNVYYIDTGAAYVYDGYQDAHLTLVEIQPNRHQEFKISTRAAY